jgi:hypothetical protein
VETDFKNRWAVTKLTTLDRTDMNQFNPALLMSAATILSSYAKTNVKPDQIHPIWEKKHPRQGERLSTKGHTGNQVRGLVVKRHPHLEEAEALTLQVWIS